jgi:two-component system response regulator
MNRNTILLVEDNPEDEALTLRVLHKGKVRNDVVVARDGQEALDFLFREGAHADRPPGNPQMVLLDLKLPKVDGLEVLRRIRAEESTRQFTEAVQQLQLYWLVLNEGVVRG